MRAAVVLGTRPEIIKLAGVIRALGDEAVVLHTGQHWDEEMSGRFFGDLGLAAPHTTLAIGGTPRGVQIGRGVEQLSAWLPAVGADVVVVQGDTNSALAGALAANAVGLPVVHVEAGLRSHDRAMPEEHNRVLIDHLADLCAAPTAVAADNLRREAIPSERIEVTGNTVVEAVADALPPPSAVAALLAGLGLTPDGFILATIHRPENTDGPQLVEILRGLAALPLPVALPLHPRTAGALAAAGAGSVLDGIVRLPPLSYPDFLGLLSTCAVAVSDSGGVQEEVTVLGRPLVVVRRSTERPEGIGTWSELVPPGPGVALAVAAVLEHLPAVHRRLTGRASPYGDGTASVRTAAAVRRAVAAA